MRHTNVDSNSQLRSGKKLTWEELAHYNKVDDAYVAIRGNVYDITNFIKRHPGGEDILLLAAGRDATQVFNNPKSADFLLILSYDPRFIINLSIGIRDLS